MPILYFRSFPDFGMRSTKSIPLGLLYVFVCWVGSGQLILFWCNACATFTFKSVLAWMINYTFTLRMKETSIVTCNIKLSVGPNLFLLSLGTLKSQQLKYLVVNYYCAFLSHLILIKSQIRLKYSQIFLPSFYLDLCDVQFRRTLWPIRE